jgi:hypothetical protein
VTMMRSPSSTKAPPCGWSIPTRHDLERNNDFAFGSKVELLEHVVHCLGDIAVARELGALLALADEVIE